MLMPAVVTGRPAAIAHCRAVLNPVRALLQRRAHDHVLDLGGLERARFTASRIAWPPRVGASVLLNAPR